MKSESRHTEPQAVTSDTPTNATPATDLSRRRWLTGAAGAAGMASASGLLLAGCATVTPEATPAKLPLPFFIGQPTQDLMPRSKAPRVVVCGGGWGGLTAARQLRQLAPDAEVVLLEKNPVFFSCPLSNKWLIDVVDDSFLTHDYLGVAQRNGYRFLQCEVTEIDRARRRVQTTAGWIEYDYLVLAPGIRYNYEAWFGNDRRAAEATRGRFPAAYIPNAEHFHLKRAMRAFKGGDWVMTLPPPPQRCPPSPYERACLIAWYFKTNKIKAKVTILDHKPNVMPISIGFRKAFEELYKDYIQYVPNAHIQEVDPFSQRIKTSAGDMHFDHAVLMAPHQAGDMAWRADAIGRTPEGQATGWADSHPHWLHLKSDDRVYVIGDAVGAVSSTFRFYPKSGHVANAHGHIVARYIADRLANKAPQVALPDNLCYMLVNGSPREALNVQFDYALNAKGEIEQTQIDDNDRRPELLDEDFKWIGQKFADLFT